MNGGTNGPMLKAAGLWAKTSVKGGQYLTGRLGGMKVLILENRDRQTDDEPSHHLFFVEAPDRRQGAQERGDGQRAPPVPLTGQRPSQSQPSGVLGHTGGIANDVPPWER
jgi:hypothetical protein